MLLTSISPQSKLGVYPVEVKVIQELCRDIAMQKDPAKARKMIAELRSIMALESDEVRLRLRLVLKRLKTIEKAISESGSSSKPPNANPAA